MSKKGFTLIELLVVIAIIALLLSVLLPSLKKAKEHARTMVCISNLKTWGLLVSLYTNDHNGSFHGVHLGGTAWQGAYREYYDGADDIRCCPSAMKLLSEGAAADDPFTAWGAFKAGDPAVTSYGFKVGDYGSYGENGYIQNGSGALADYFKPGGYWKNINQVRGAANVPIFLGANWMGSFVDSDHHGPVRAPNYSGGVGGGLIDRYMMDRHNGYVGGVFCDLSARKVGMKELFTLKWHRRYDTRKWYNEQEALRWPEWMAQYKDY